jgi:hypothetical protein
MFFLMVIYWNERRRARPFLAIGLALGFLVVVILHQTNFIGKITGQQLPGEMDPLRRVRGWQSTARLVETEREKLETAGKPAFIIANHYGMTGQCTFYSPPARTTLKSDKPLVYCVDSEEPKNQLFYWPEYRYRDNRKGQNAIYVTSADLYPLESGWVWKWLKHQPVGYGQTPSPLPAPDRITQEFEAVTDLGESEIEIGNRVVRRVHLWACFNLK